MNQEQVMALVRALLMAVGSAMVTKGWISSSFVEPIIGLIVMASPVIWSMFVHTQSNAVAVVGKLAKDPTSPVQAVIVAPTSAGDDLVKATANPLVVPAGTAAAISLAK